MQQRSTLFPSHLIPIGNIELKESRAGQKPAVEGEDVVSKVTSAVHQQIEISKLKETIKKLTDISTNIA
jgi:hypothetical protein